MPEPLPADPHGTRSLSALPEGAEAPTLPPRGLRSATCLSARRPSPATRCWASWGAAAWASSTGPAR
jgi:hypothetical protein